MVTVWVGISMEVGLYTIREIRFSKSSRSFSLVDSEKVVSYTVYER